MASDDPAYVRVFKEYTRTEPAWPDLAEMEKEFYGESDRAITILQGALFEVALETAIKRKMRPDLGVERAKGLFDFERPIGSFSAKIAVGHALGIFHSQTIHDLDLIRMLRNAAAHMRRPYGFSIAEIGDVCRNLQIPDAAGVAFTPSGFWQNASDKTIEAAQEKTDPKRRYITACHSISHHLLQFGLDKEGKFATAMLP